MKHDYGEIAVCIIAGVSLAAAIELFVQVFGCAPGI